MAPEDIAATGMWLTVFTICWIFGLYFIKWVFIKVFKKPEWVTKNLILKHLYGEHNSQGQDAQDSKTTQ